jgi:predicted nucleotidyltransferase
MAQPARCGRPGFRQCDNGPVDTARTGIRLDEVIRLLVDSRALLRPFHIEALFVFGSVARDQATSHSDVDLLVDFDETPTLFEFARLRRVLSEVLGRPVDLVARDALKPQLRERILSEAVRAA